ncbi:MAG: hypothetical protein VZQ83_10290 [Eubacterium sp.]|nr:hypothetical protein [Eubacterium sp.]
MLYWYRDLMTSKKLRSKTDKHIHRVERYYRALPKSKVFSDKKKWWEQIVGKRIPWKDYTVVIKSLNESDLFDIMATRQWVFRAYEKRDIYVIGLFTSKDDALEQIEAMLTEGYEADPAYDPRAAFSDPESFDTYTDEEVGAVAHKRRKK